MAFEKIVVSTGEKITVNADFSLTVPAQPIIPFIEGDGIGRDITPVMRKAVDAAVAKAYGGRRRIAWREVYVGGKAVARWIHIATGQNRWAKPGSDQNGTYLSHE